MGSRERASDKTLQDGRLRELLAESLSYVDGYQWYCSNNIKQFVLLPITEVSHVYKSTDQRRFCYVLL